MNLVEKYLSIRKYSEELCQPLQTEDYVVQPVVDVVRRNGIWAIPHGFSKPFY